MQSLSFYAFMPKSFCALIMPILKCCNICWRLKDIKFNRRFIQGQNIIYIYIYIYIYIHIVYICIYKCIYKYI